MRAISLILVLSVYTCSGHPALARAAVSQFRCANIPYWVRNYGIAQINPVLHNLGMLRWQIARVDRCLAPTNDPSYSIGP
jgi:hypothetical protein